MKCRSYAASETFIEMQYLGNIYGPSLVGLAKIGAKRNIVDAAGKVAPLRETKMNKICPKLN